MFAVILGGGMSGLVAAKALEDLSISFDIIDKGEVNVSQQVGLHYLHGNLNLPLEPHRIKNLVSRDLKQVGSDNYLYSMKVWGNASTLNNSMVNLPAETTVYDFREAFLILKNMFKHDIIITEFKPDMIKQLKHDYDIIINTLPLYILFPECKCEFHTVWANSVFPKGVELNDFTVMYNIAEGIPWYRCSKVFGQTYTEYVKYEQDCFPINKIKTISNLDENYLNRNHIILAGRFGEWNRKRLVHEVYDLVQRRVTSLEY